MNIFNLRAMFEEQCHVKINIDWFKFFAKNYALQGMPWSCVVSYAMHSDHGGGFGGLDFRLYHK